MTLHVRPGHCLQFPGRLSASFPDGPDQYQKAISVLADGHSSNPGHYQSYDVEVNIHSVCAAVTEEASSPSKRVELGDDY
jgi:hypothetical protein